jgi:hypothetical protein
MSGEARLVLFESWVNAALRGGDWIVPLTCSATLLEARAAVLVLSESGRTRCKSRRPSGIYPLLQ